MSVGVMSKLVAVVRGGDGGDGVVCEVVLLEWFMFWL